MKILLNENKPYYKANLHSHTTLSDGKRSAEEVKERYKAMGYSAVAFTDHEHVIDQTRLCDDGFIAITAAELAIKEFADQSTLKNFNMKVAHFNIYALDPHNDITPCYSSIYDHYVTDKNRDLIKFEGECERVYSPEFINEMIKEVHKRGFLISYNHPTWSLETARDYLAYEGLDFVEIYNTGCVKLGHTTDERVFDDMLAAGKKIFCTAADDNHNSTGFDSPDSDSFGGWVMVNADELTYESLMNALKDGIFYASSGPSIYSLTQDGYKIRAKFSPVKSIHLLTKGRHTYASYASEGEYITEAEFTVCDADELFRIRLTDEHGKCAYSQAYEVV